MPGARLSDHDTVGRLLRQRTAEAGLPRLSLPDGQLVVPAPPDVRVDDPAGVRTAPDRGAEERTVGGSPHRRRAGRPRLHLPAPAATAIGAARPSGRIDEL